MRPPVGLADRRPVKVRGGEASPQIQADWWSQGGGVQVWEGLYCPITPDKGLSRTDTANRPVKYTGRAAKGLGLAQSLGSDLLVVLGRKRYSTCLKGLCCTAFDHVVKPRSYILPQQK